MTDESTPDDEPELSEVRGAEHLQFVATRAERRAERRRLSRLGVWAAIVTIVLGLADAWAPSRWVWFPMVVVPAYISGRLLFLSEPPASVRARGVPRELLVTGALTLAGLALLAPAHVLVLQPLLGNGIGLATVTAAALFAVWTLSAWWATR